MTEVAGGGSSSRPAAWVGRARRWAAFAMLIVRRGSLQRGGSSRLGFPAVMQLGTGRITASFSGPEKGMAQRISRLAFGPQRSLCRRDQPGQCRRLAQHGIVAGV